ncbi:ATP synthase delta chain [Acidisarcina polymorpha]|uniref:ATP synthase subunit delta n=1 Tax=Acidisarcina polymorpha TaxID=2211140 RepID=A0A2Z5FWU6_9BACT|nr:ATP synthase F1 subunit delta [Acidisarcina polymorpha]AXC11369.1 ATP synthase delta chain [Acidisarcina polymorpha]
MSLFATRYARAFAEAVEGAKLDPAEVSRQLDDFAFAWDESPQLRQVLEDPVFPSEQKVGILDKLNERIGLSPIVRNFIAVLINHDRIAAFSEVASEYRLEMDRRQGIYEVDIISARPLGDDERQGLEAQVGELAGGRVNARYRQDESLLGGVIVKLGSTVYDGSVRGQLDRLREELAAS